MKKCWGAALVVVAVVVVVQASPSASRSRSGRQASRPRQSFLAGLGGGEGTVLGSLFQLAAKDMKQEQDPPPPPLRQQKQSEEAEQQGTKQQGKGGMSASHAAAAVGKLMRQLHNMTFLPLVPRKGAPPPAPENGTLLQQYLDVVRGDAWGQLKSLVVGYSGWLEHEYQLNHITERLPLGLVKKVLDLGDRVNFLRVVGRRVDPGLAGFLANQLQPMFDHFNKVTAGRLVNGSLATSVGQVVRGAAWKTLRQFVDHVLSVAGGAVTREELHHFREDLAKTSPLAAQGLQMLLEGPPMEEGRSLARQGYRDYHEGYGGHGAYDDSYATYGGMQSYSSGGGGGGYAAGVHMDPYLILAGLGAAVLLAYLAYRVLVTTEAAAAEGGRGMLDDLALMDLSDTPSVLHSLHTLLDDAELKYDVKRSANRDDMDDFSDALNGLWQEHERPDGCVRCALFHATLDYARVGQSSASAPALAVSMAAHLLGAARTGQLVDGVTGQVLEGRPVTCLRHDHTCDLK